MCVCMCVCLCVCVFPWKVDPDLATEQAAALHEARTSNLMGTDDDVFLEILGLQSRAQIQVRCHYFVVDSKRGTSVHLDTIRYHIRYSY